MEDLFIQLPHYEDAEYPRETLEKQIKSAKNQPMSYEIKKQITKLKLYNLAKNTVPWNEKGKIYLSGSFNNKLKLLKKGIVAESTWKTFRNFVNIWDSFENKEKYKLLPLLYSYDEEHISQDYAEGSINLRSNKIEIDLTKLNTKIKIMEEHLKKNQYNQKNLTLLATFIIAILVFIFFKMY